MKSDILAYFLTPTGNTFTNAVLFVMSAYLIFEAVDAAIRMNRGDRLCRVAKYLLTCMSGVLGIIFSISNLAIPVFFLLVGALDLFLWPTMLYRFRGEYRNRIND